MKEFLVAFHWALVLLSFGLGMACAIHCILPGVFICFVSAAVSAAVVGWNARDVATGKEQAL